MNKQKQLGRYLNSGTRYYVTHPHEFFIDLYRELRDFVKRGIYGYADSDLWSLDWYISSWLPSALRDMEKEIYSCPVELFDEKKKDNEAHKWREILLEISNGFEAYYELHNDSEWTPAKQEIVDEKLKKSFKLMSEWFGAFWN